jgi:hypothetical protein
MAREIYDVAPRSQPIERYWAPAFQIKAVFPVVVEKWAQHVY